MSREYRVLMRPTRLGWAWWIERRGFTGRWYRLSAYINGWQYEGWSWTQQAAQRRASRKLRRKLRSEQRYIEAVAAERVATLPTVEEAA